MYRLTNKLDRDIGLPAENRGGVLLVRGETRTVSNEHYRELIKAKKTQARIKSGALIAQKVEPGSEQDKGDF